MKSEFQLKVRDAAPDIQQCYQEIDQILQGFTGDSLNRKISAVASRIRKNPEKFAVLCAHDVLTRVVGKSPELVLREEEQSVYIATLISTLEGQMLQ